MESKSTVMLTIDGKEIAVPEGTTVLEAAKSHDIRIPTLCYHPDLSPYGGCRLCVVEVDEAPRLVASCVTPVRNGMRVVTINERIVEARRTILEFMLSEKSHYCMFCAQSGDCELQNLLYEYQIDHLTIPSLDQTFPVDTSHREMAWDHNRCILCGRCVRACREISGNSVLDYQGRGGGTMIGVDLATGIGQSTCVSCGVCLEFCPTGAIFNRHRTHYAVKGKSKDWRSVESVCAECGLFCPAIYHVAGNNIIKVESPSHGQGPDRGQLCRKGRFDPVKQGDGRLGKAWSRVNRDGWQPVHPDEAVTEAADRLWDLVGRYGGEAVWGLVSPGCSNEEIGAFAALFKSCFPSGRLESLHGRHDRNLMAAGQGRGINEASWDDILTADFILEIGADPSVSHPIVHSLVKRTIFENHAAVALIGPENPFGDWAFVHVPAEDRRLVDLLNVLASGRWPDNPDLPDRQALEDLAEKYRQSGKPVFILGPMLTGLKGAEALERALDLAGIRPAAHSEPTRVIVLKWGANSAGVREYVPVEAGPGRKNRYRAGLVLMSEGDRPDPDLQKDLADLDFLVVITPVRDPFWRETAHVLIPKPTRLESDGTFTPFHHNRSVFKPRVLNPPEQITPTVNILSVIRERFEKSRAGKDRDTDDVDRPPGQGKEVKT